MLEWTIRVLRECRLIRQCAWEALEADRDDKADAVGVLKARLIEMAKTLRAEMPKDLTPVRMTDLRRHCGYGMSQDFKDIVAHDIPSIEEEVEAYARAHAPPPPAPPPPVGFGELLHPAIAEVALHHFQSGHYREAVLNAITRLFDYMRERTGLDCDGDDLCNLTFSPNDPLLVLSDMTSDSGRNDQRGFMDIFKGVYMGIRNPKAHTLTQQLEKIPTAQYLVLASALMRRLEAARRTTKERPARVRK